MKKDQDSALQTWPTLAVAVLAVVLAALHALEIARIDEVTVQLTLIALGAAAFAQVKNLKLTKDGVELERIEARVDEIEKGTQQIAKLVAPVDLATDAQPATTSASGTGPATNSPTLAAPTDPEDPNKGRFGGSSRVNGRVLSAVVEKLFADPGWYLVTLKVQSSTPARALTTPVDFHLHPTFANAVAHRAPLNGEATVSLKAWGAFTVGAITDGGATSLELDLASDAVGAPKEFRER